MQLPFLRESLFCIGLHSLKEYLPECSAWFCSSDKGGVHTADSLCFTTQFIWHATEVHQPCDGAHQAPLPPTKHKHRVSVQPFVCGERMAKGEHALICGHKINYCLYSALFAF